MFVAQRRPRRAAAAVEFALVAPLLFLLVLGMIEFSRMMMVQQILTNAAREGARAAVLPGATDTQVNALIDGYLTGTGITGHTRSVPANLAGITPGQPVTVRVGVLYDNVSWLPAGLLRWGQGRQLTATVVMRKE